MTTNKLDFRREDLNGTPIEIGPGSWVCGELHCPGGTANLKINNRAFVFRLTLKESLGGIKAGKDALLIYGLGKDKIIQGVKDLESKTSLKAVALLCNGGGHHIQIKKWYNAFPEMQVWVCPTKVPTTLNGEMLRKEYPNRWELVDNTTVPHHVNQLLQYFDQVDCILFNQLFGYKDTVSRDANFLGSPKDADKKLSVMEFIRNMSSVQGDLSQPTDDVIFFHGGLKLIITGHHVEFVYMPPSGYTLPPEMEFEGGWFFQYIVPKMFFSPGRYTSMAGIPNNRIGNFKVHAEQWQQVMKWDFQFACSHHDPPRVCGPIDNAAIMEGEGGLKGHLERELTRTGELTGEPDAGSWWPYRNPNVVYKLQSKEANYRKQFGEPPAFLPMGGPGYDEIGKKK